MKDAPNINYFWTSLLIEELCRLGCTHFVVASGSRSAPLAGAVAMSEKAHHTIAFDERSAAFFALGHAKATGLPAAVIVTSGTAVANLMPAVVEASLDRIPLIILTADRPWELRDVGANQTICQTNFFAPYTRWFFELPCPEEKTPPSMVLSVVSYAVWQSRYPLAGPVHLNCLFREPLAPWEKSYTHHDAVVHEWIEGTKPSTRYERPQKLIDELSLKQLAMELNAAKEGLIVVGAQRDQEAPRALLKLACHLGWPLVVDIASGLRQNEHSHIIRCDHYLWASAKAKALNFDVVLQFGGRLISKPLEEMLATRRGKTHVLIDDHAMRSDPYLSITHRYDGDTASICCDLLATLPASKPTFALTMLQALSQKAQKAMQALEGEGQEATEPFVASHVSKNITRDSMLMACTSMPIRDYHIFASYRADGGPTIMVNRGASGIDGLISTAAGFALASRKRTTVIIGDMAFMHDANAMALLKDVPFPIAIIVINNQGGGIFSFLPIAQFPNILTPFINTPHEHDLSGLAHAFGLKHQRVHTKIEFAKAYEEAQACAEHRVLEVRTERQANYALHERIRAEVLAACEVADL